ncbi:hypothetical protein HK097_006251 [Rhizophlyctis rosea]|uniref:NAD(P)-binding protein n=1 Tax=Rhizophlyctis rosea TaxID=64517 RepID=A0AAD5SKR3_9FUNG|nr:hypothetical protein HK097_006251 [Rhizophlyctis rosea]
MSDNWNWKVALITGGAGGLGRYLAEYLVKMGKVGPFFVSYPQLRANNGAHDLAFEPTQKVIIAGRTESNLKQTASEVPGLEYIVVDVGKVDNLAEFVKTATTRFPDIDCVISKLPYAANPNKLLTLSSTSAGIQKPISFPTTPVTQSLLSADEEIDTNIRGTVHLITHFLPHLLSKPSSAVFTVSSGLAFIPIHPVPVYCATKAFIHSYTQTLRLQLKNTSVRVVEIAPPLVESDLHRDHSNPDNNKKTNNSFALSAEEFIRDVDRDMNAGLDVVAPGFTRGRVDKEDEIFKADFDKFNGRQH